jgi:hypothetical protein
VIQDIFEARQRLELAVSQFETTVAAAVSLSEVNIGVNHTGRQKRALFLFAKMIVHEMSMLLIVGRFLSAKEGFRLLDHSSLATLARTAIDSALMVMYISHPKLTRDEWNLRRYVLYLHDLTNRKRFLAATGRKDLPFYDHYEVSKAEMIQKIRRFAKALRVDAAEVSELTKGQRVFVSGARGAVREAGWDVQEYDFIQSYTSPYVHSHPVSFMRAEENAISFQEPAKYQLDFSVVVFSMATECTARVTRRMATFSVSGIGDPLGQVDD